MHWIDETGIVASLASPMSKCQIDVFYMSTFTTDYSLVPSEAFDRTLQVLKQSKFSVSE